MKAEKLSEMTFAGFERKAGFRSLFSIFQLSFLTFHFFSFMLQ
jgi:hypothetical protein